MGALFNIQKVCKYDQEGNATDHRPTHDWQKRTEETEKKTERNTEHRQWVTKRIKDPPDLTPAQNDWNNNIYYKQWLNNNRTTAFNQPTPLGWVLKLILLATNLYKNNASKLSQKHILVLIYCKSININN